MSGAVELGMVAVARTAAVEAFEADVKACRIVDGVKALCAVLAVDQVGWPWLGEVYVSRELGQ